MRVIKDGYTKKQIMCNCCGVVIEIDLKYDVPLSGPEDWSFKCPVCKNTLRPKLLLEHELMLDRRIREETNHNVLKELKELYEILLTRTKSRSLTAIEKFCIDDILIIISERINELIKETEDYSESN